MCLVASLSMLFGVLGGKFSSDASAKFAGNLREDIYKNIQSFSFQNIDRFSTSSLITRFTGHTLIYWNDQRKYPFRKT